jgi:hypothetical protein
MRVCWTDSGSARGSLVNGWASSATRTYLLALVGLLTFTMQQNAFRAAGLSASLPSSAVLEAVVGLILGLASYHERVGSSGIRIAVEALAVLAAIWGITRLANSVMAELARLAPAATPPAGPAG